MPYKNDIGESMEVLKYHKYGFQALEKYKTSTGLIYFNDGDSLVIVSRIADAVLEAVLEERRACAETVRKYIDIAPDHNFSVNLLVETAAMEINARDYSEAKKALEAMRTV